jgi:DNA-binding HxlR family transcriptional regulator
MAKKSRRRRSTCPINAALEVLGDRWSLLIVRDLMLHGDRTYKDFLASDEGIATNILADRLKKLADFHIITVHADPVDGRKQIYGLTRKGIDLAPVLAELVVWALQHEHMSAPPAMTRSIATGRAQFLADLRARWEERHRHVQSARRR